MIPFSKFQLRFFPTVALAAVLSILQFVIPSLGRDCWAETNLNLSRASVTLGIGGVWKVGHECPAQIAIPADWPSVDRCELVTLDGDNVEVAYECQLIPASGQSEFQTAETCVRIGRRNVPPTLNAFRGEELLYSQEMTQEVLGRALPSDQLLVVCIGSQMGLEKLVRRSANGEQETFSSTLVETTSNLPNHWRAYTGCDLLVISTSNKELISSITDVQWQAIVQWIERGGNCLISLADASEAVIQSGNLKSILPGNLVRKVRIANPKEIESLVTTDSPLGDFSAMQLEVDRGETRLSMSDTLNNRIRWWTVYQVGSGTVQCIASDLGDPTFQNWKDFKLLWGQFFEVYWPRTLWDRSSDDRSKSTYAYLGYEDLVGQLRATLDLFPQIKQITFGQVSALLVLLLLIVGPIDYILSVRWLRRPHMSWYFSGAVLLGSSGVLAYVYANIRSDKLLVNSAQIIDFDFERQRMSGWMWTHMYSSSPRQVNVSVESKFIPKVWLDWQGLPGTGLGGLESQLNVDRGMPPYRVAADPEGGTSLDLVGITSGGTKSLQGVWDDDFPMTGQSQLKELSRVDQLEGTLVNPLPFEIQEGVLFYHRWYYILNSRIPAGEQFTISSENIPKDVARRLIGQRQSDNKVLTTKWNPSERTDLDKLLELMMFYKASTGQNYAQLTHRFQPIVDRSSLLDSDYAILVGKVAEPFVALKVEDKNGQPIEMESEEDRKRVTWVRIFIPVSSE